MKWDQFPVTLPETHLFNRQMFDHIRQEEEEGLVYVKGKGLGETSESLPPASVPGEDSGFLHLSLGEWLSQSCHENCFELCPWLPCPPDLQFKFSPFGYSGK